MIMDDVTSYSKERLAEMKESLEKEYAAFAARNLKLDMSRGKPSGAQLNLTNDILKELDHYTAQDGMDARNYGGLTGIPEAKQMFSELLDLPEERIIVGGNSSLNLMYDTIVRHMLFGTHGNVPWSKRRKIRFLCPAPGYDRHFAICEDMGIEMIPVPMTENGPDMDVVEALAASDDSIKGIWCVPLYSNPQGICYSDETVDRLASMHAAEDFRIMWDNAYGVHHIYGERKVKDIFQACEEAGNPDRAYYFFSTSKITFPGAGVAILASSPANLEEVKKHMGVQTIGHDKINQLRTVKFLKNADGVRAHMRRLAQELRPKFDIVLSTLERELAGSGLASWAKPEGGYFVAVDTLPGCAKEVVALAGNAGVVMTGAGATFPYKKDPADRNIRIAPTYPACEELQTAIDLFCICVKLAGVKKLLAE